MGKSIMDRFMSKKSLYASFWIVSIFMVTILIYFTANLAKEVPPLPKQVSSVNGEVLYTYDDIVNGKAMFQQFDLMDYGGQLERKIVPYFFLLLTLSMIGYLYWNSKWSWLLMVVPIVLPLGFLVEYAGWLYWYGHNMQDWGAFTIKPFMPTVFGDGKVAQFTTHSYPSTGYYIMIVASILSILAVFSRIKEQKEA